MDTWTVTCYAMNGQQFDRRNVEFYEIQEVLYELSRLAYLHGTSCLKIVIS